MCWPFVSLASVMLLARYGACCARRNANTDRRYPLLVPGGWASSAARSGTPGLARGPESPNATMLTLPWAASVAIVISSLEST